VRGQGFGRGARGGAKSEAAEARRTAKSASRPAQPLTEERVRGWVTAYLSRYGTTTDHLRKHLLRKVDTLRRALPEDDTAFPATAEVTGWIDEAIASGVRAGFLNDDAWAESKTRRLLDRGVSPSMVRERLGGKGIAREAAGVALASVAASSGEDPTLASARALVRRRRLGPWRASPAVRKAERQKDLGKLGRAGFPYAVAKRVLDESLDEASGEGADDVDPFGDDGPLGEGEADEEDGA